MTTKRLSLSILAASLACVMLLGGCGLSSAIVEGLSEEHFIYAGTTPHDPESREFREVLSRDGLTLYVNDKTAEIAVRDTAGVMWYSNPQERAADPVASEENKDNMSAQARIVYSDSTGNVRSMNTYTDAVSRGQFRITAEGDTLAVRYTLGAVEEKKLVPIVVEQERFETLILNRLTDTQKKTLERYYMLVDLDNMQDQNYRRELEVKYPAAKKGPVWVLRNNPPAPNIEDKIHEIVVMTGYTREDLEADNAANQVADSGPDMVFNLVIRYTIEDGRLLVTLPADELEMPTDYLIERVCLLEHFGAALKGSDGYLLLPDGSGSLLYFDNGKDTLAAYSVPVYGRDKALYMEENPYNADGVNLPVFGLKNGASAFLAVIEKGDALANVGARSSGSTTSYNTVYAEFRVREKAVQTIGGTDNVQNIYQQERYKGAFSVSYRFLSGEDAGYVGMAKAYRATLFDGQSAPIREKRPLYLELIGAIDVTENVAGIPVGKTRALTSFEEAAAILEELGASGADLSSVVVRYSGLWNGGMRQGYADRLHVVGALGGPEGFASLRDTAAAMGAALYPDIDLQYVYRNSPFDSYNVRRDTARFLIRTTAAVYPYNPATFALDTQARPRYLISPRRYGSLFASFGSAYAAFSCTGVSLRSVGRDLAADYREGQAVDRQTALDGLTEALDGLDAYSLLVENGNAYTLSRSSHVVELPMDSCGYDATDESVPFLQLVVSGCLNYAGKPVNLAAGSRRSFLRAVETGAGLSYTVTAAGSDKVRDTDYTRYFACAWAAVKPSLLETLDEAAPAAPTAGLEMTGHVKLADGVYQTTFSNGMRVVVNYTGQPYTGPGVHVEAENYAVL